MAIEEGPPLVLERGKSLAEAAYDEMRTLIGKGEWPPRTKLPSEAELSRRFGMSRPVVRQALAMLRDEGLIQSRQGAGSFVLAVPAAPETPAVSFPAIASVADLEAFLYFREGVEAEMAGVAALRRTQAQLEAVVAAAKRLAAQRDSAELAGDDYAFHLAVAEASGNPFSINMIKSVRQHMLLGIGLLWDFSAKRGDFRVTVERHQSRITGAIRRSNPSEASQAMREHLAWSRSWLLKGHANDADRSL